MKGETPSLGFLSCKMGSHKAGVHAVPPSEVERGLGRQLLLLMSPPSPPPGLEAACWEVICLHSASWEPSLTRPSSHPQSWPPVLRGHLCSVATCAPWPPPIWPLFLRLLPLTLLHEKSFVLAGHSPAPETARHSPVPGSFSPVPFLPGSGNEHHPVSQREFLRWGPQLGMSGFHDKRHRDEFEDVPVGSQRFTQRSGDAG